jgi:poly(3-hydroxybutyrate) depolymerase
VILATYPEIFAAGAIIAGLPYGAAANVQEAFASMQGRSRTSAEWAELVRRASSHPGPWPKVSVWHGSADATVHPLNADEIVKQWTALHGLSVDPTKEDRGSGYSRRVWCSPAGDELIESYTVIGMAHGLPLAIGPAPDRCGNAGAFFLDVGISSSFHIAKFWDLIGDPHIPADEEITLAPISRELLHGPQEQVGQPIDVEPRQRNVQGPAFNVQAVIENALKAAGLMK